MDLFSGLKMFFKWNTTNIDNFVFRLHYKMTSIILAAFSILVTAKQYIGDPIDCIPVGAYPSNMLDTFCWVHSTFSLPTAWNRTVGKEVPYPGIDNHRQKEERVYHFYYQWVCFVLLLQSIMFYVPRYFWTIVEGKKVKSLLLGLHDPVITEETKVANIGMLAGYLMASHGSHNSYFAKFVASEAMNFANVVGQMFLIDRFLGGEFSKYGTKVLEFTDWDGSVRYDPMIKVFPRLTKCEYFLYGPSGDVQRHNTMCVLPVNVINEKIYIFIWFWFIILAVFSGLSLLYRIAVFYWPRSRFLITSARARFSNKSSLEMIITKSKIGDWFLLDLLSKNLDPLNFREVVAEFSRLLDSEEESSPKEKFGHYSYSVPKIKFVELFDIAHKLLGCFSGE